MVTLSDAPVNLFSKDLPSFEDIKKLWKYVNSSERNRISFCEQAEKQTDSLVQGIALLLSGKSSQAIEKLNRGKECLQKHMALGYAFRKSGNYASALEAFDKTGGQAEGLTISIEKAETYRMAGDLAKCAKELKNCSNFENVSSEYHYQMGRLLDAQGDYEKAISQYEHAVDLDGENIRALFQLAYSLDLRGDDEAALYYYRELAQVEPAHVNGLLNLAVIYEDLSEYDKALACVESVLESHPNHAKAELFRKDLSSARVMVYDEEKEKRRDRQNKILEVPISDFELSVRSRNCLKKMNIITLGDLLKTTEAELLSYKNFGETSLQEIKKILDSKGLRLGMALEEKGAVKTMDPEIASQASPEILHKTVDDLELSVRARRALERLGVKSVLELINKTEAELLGCKNFGITSLNEIKERLGNFGLSLRTLE